MVQNWKNEDILQKEVKSCDNQALGDAKEVDGQYLVVRKGMRTTRIPRQAIAAFDGDKIYLRVTEAEALAGIYPFINGDNADYSKPNTMPQYNTPTSATASPA
jgi:hypothetical protein